MCSELMRERKEEENEKKRCRNDVFHRCYGYWYTGDKEINAVRKSWRCCSLCRVIVEVMLSNEATLHWDSLVAFRRADTVLLWVVRAHRWRFGVAELTRWRSAVLVAVLLQSWCAVERTGRVTGVPESGSRGSGAPRVWRPRA
jgi:hypothetical protein